MQIYESRKIGPAPKFFTMGPFVFLAPGPEISLYSLGPKCDPAYFHSKVYNHNLHTTAIRNHYHITYRLLYNASLSFFHCGSEKKLHAKSQITIKHEIGACCDHFDTRHNTFCTMSQYYRQKIYGVLAA